MESNSQAQNKLYRVFLIGFFLILALPLFNIQPWFSPPAWGKAISFRFIISILIFLFLYQIISEKIKIKLPNRKSRAFFPFWLLIILAGIYLLSTIFSLNPHFSFWGSPYRAGGSLNFILYIIFAVLTFLIIKEKGWQKIWNVAFLVGALVCLIALFQRLELFSDVLIPRTERAIATMGSAILLALYLLLLTFLSLSFGIKTKGKKRLFYFFCFGFFFLTLFLTGGKASFFGFGIGLLFFIFLYPAKNSSYPKKILWFKISIALFLILLILGAFWLNDKPEIVQSLGKNKFFGMPFARIWGALQPFLNIHDFSFSKITTDNRFSGWKVAFQALKERPIFGYGPENFAVAFDKHYDPFLPGFNGNDWWDRAHNFIFDISVTAGIPALIIFLSLITVIFWKLQRLKNQYKSAQISINPCLVHGIQATFIAYLVANFFSFDAFSTYLIFFLLTGYSLFLISRNQPEVVNINPQNQHKSALNKKPLWKSISIFGLFCFLVWFLWVAALKPLQINKEINWANYYVSKGKCPKAIEKMEKILPSHSVIDSYLRLSYIDIITNCQKQSSELKLKLAPKLAQILKESTELRPNYTRNWWFLGIANNSLINNQSKYTRLNIEEIKNQANTAFEQAHQLSPKRWSIVESWIATFLLTGEYQKAIEKAQKCLELNPDEERCWFQKALANIALGNIKKGKEDLDKAKEKGFALESFKERGALVQLTQAYSKGISYLTDPSEKREAYQELVKIYKRLIYHERKNFQYHASLAYVYKELGDYKNAAQEAITVFALSPQSRPTVEEFLYSLPITPSYYWGMAEFYKRLINESPKNPQYHSSLAFVYARIGEYEKAKKEAMIVLELSPGSKADVEEFLQTLPE